MRRRSEATVGSVVLCTLWVSMTTSFGAEIGNVCVRAYSSGRECTANDVSISALMPVSIVEDCASGDPDTAEAIFDLWISAGGESRYDIGVFLALNGDSALSGGQCLHDYLEPPITTSPTYVDADADGRPEIHNGPWWNGEPFVLNDDCGDMEANTEAVKRMLSLRFACVDSNLDGTVDFSTCTSWSSGTMTRCSALSDAIAGSNTRCHCGIVESGVPMRSSGLSSGRVADLTVDKNELGELLLSWPASCVATDTDYAVYEGLLGSFYSHQSVLCSTGGATSAIIEPRPEDSYYLIVPRNSGREGSYGLDGVGAERPPSTSACLAQQVGGCL